MPYIGTQPKDVRSFGRAQFDFTATQGQTDFIGADDDGKQLGYTEGQVQVYVNGILMDDADYNTSALGNAIYLTSAANLNDIITVVALQTDIPNSDYVPISGGTFSGDMNFSGDLTVGATAIHVDRTNNRLGVGTYSPTGVLSLKNGTRTLDVKLEDSPPSGEYGVQFTAGSGDYLGFGAGGSGTAIAIDSTNRVTMPSQPAFRAYSTNSGWTTLAADTWVIAALEAEEYDQGSNYNTTNYRFTVPIDGLYQFTLHAYARIQSGGQTASTNYWSARFGKNGNTQGDHCIVGYYSDGEQDNTCTITSTLDLSANDYIEIYLRGHGYNAEYYRSLCRFEGRLVG